MKFIKVMHTDYYKKLFIDLYKKQDKVLYNHSIVYPFSYLNKGRLQLYLRRGIGKSIIPVIKKHKKKAQFSLYSPYASKKLIKETIKYLDKKSYKPVFIQDTTEKYAEWFLKDNEDQYKKVKTSEDLIFDTEITKALKGKQFENLRKRLNKFKRTYEIESRQLNKSTLKDALYVFKKWKEVQGKKYFRAVIGRDLHLVEEYADKIDNKNLFCYIHYIEEKPVSCAFGARAILKDDWGMLVTNKALINYKGLSDFTRIHMLNILNDQGIRYINDSGKYGKGIEDFKRKYKPITEIATYDIKPK